MISHPMFPLVELTVVASAAALLVGLLRIPLRHAVGAQAAYWLWLLVPASALAVLLPAPSQSVEMATVVVPDTLNHAVAGAVVALTGTSASMNYAVIGLLLWVAGALLMLALTVRRQRAFVRSLGSLRSLPNGTYRSASVIEPMLVGAWRPRVVLPADFETRYTPEECALVLAHERAHLQRGDALINALATGWLCLSWFNPLMYWAVGRLRFDQELACDAQVLASTGTARRRYADALLKTQLAADSVGSVPIACHWQSSHPLKERIAALKRPLPSFVRRVVGVVLALILIVAGSYTVWASHPEPGPMAIPAAPVAVEMKEFTGDVDLSASGPVPILGDGQIHLAALRASATRTVLVSQTNTPKAHKSVPHRCPISGKWVGTL